MTISLGPFGHDGSLLHRDEVGAVATTPLRPERYSSRDVVDVPDEIDAIFRSQTGMSFARWQHSARMRVARDLLARRVKPSAVASRVGYSQVSNFSRAFTRFHGVSPRVYQEWEADAS